jgi:maltose alpha-D-glucosyltransferase/alpha-amylase
MTATTPDWYKDVVIYQLHVKAFFDANDDGVGDFAGLTSKLDYLQELGVTAIWLLPFYPSPLKDDGYDIADYRNVHPAYGTMRDFRRLVEAAHERGLRVITELVINHTSDQHRWFQRARHARKGSAHRDWYVWSDTPDKYAGTRIIFTDTETSNWTWDPVAGQYFWHRFFSHQPDLNFDNPQVVRAIVNTMQFWLEFGVDGFRLDAIPYLIERDGTSSENLPETHDVIRHIRAELDRMAPGKLLLAEANQWPEDVKEYFGQGDECHMAFHFPLMPRMYMAIAREDRHPITDIMRQTPEIPETCQWALFLRNHDELTLEMVTAEERDYLWSTYAADPRARVNVGIRRRLAPLMNGDRRKIELMNAILMSMPGTPIIYYGDEIGMGDNIFLGDRNGVRTPMQWTPDRNAGFSRTDPARLYLPAIMDPIYGFQAVNVEAQARSLNSLLNWMRRLIAVRQAYPAFGRGQLVFLYPSNRTILAYLRVHGETVILVVCNLSRSAQAVELDLAAYAGRVPVEMLGGTRFPSIGQLTYLVTLAGYGFYWFELKAADQSATAPAQFSPEWITLVLQTGWENLLSGRSRAAFEHDVLPAWLAQRRWFAGKGTGLPHVEMTDGWRMPTAAEGGAFLATLNVSSDSGTGRYLLVLAIDPVEAGPGANAIAKVRRGPREGYLHDAVTDERFIRALIEHFRARHELPAGDRGRLVFRPGRTLADHPNPDRLQVRAVGLEQSNSTILVDDFAVVKVLRKIEHGIHPEVEMGRYLTDVAGFANTPALLGTLEHVEADGTPTALVVMHAFVRNQGDGWTHTLNYLDRFLEDYGVLPSEERLPPGEAHAVYLREARQLGQRVAEMHRALARETDDPAFRPRPLSPADIEAWTDGIVADAGETLDLLEARLGMLAPADREKAMALLARRGDVTEALRAFVPEHVDAAMIRIHGDLHLGQVLIAQNDFYIVDFEGEPARPLDERRRHSVAARDVAGIVRSFDYAATAAVQRLNPVLASVEAPAWTAQWRRLAVDAFLTCYRTTMEGSPAWPADPAAAQRLLSFFLIDKALYEIRYELLNRPDWVGLPLGGVLSILFPEPEADLGF